MNKKTMMVLIALAIACTALFLMTSCTTKEATVEDTTPAPPPGPTEAEIAKAKADAAAKAKAEAEAKAKAEAAALARQEMADFESINIYFDFDKSELTDEAQAVLMKKAEYLKKNPKYDVRIAGNCDERGTNEYNLALGDRRAHAAYDFLLTMGVSKNRMTTISYGEEKPLDSGSGEAAWAKNRNDQFVLVK